MHPDDPVDRRIGERQGPLIDQTDKAATLARPLDYALFKRHEGDDPFRFRPERVEIRRGIAKAEKTEILEVRPHLPDFTADDPAHHLAEGAVVKIPQIDNIRSDHG